MSAKESPVPNVRAVTRALAVLRSFADSSAQSLAQVTQATGLDKGTTRRLLLTLMSSGFIAQDPATQHYRLGRALRELSASVADDPDLRSLAQPVLADLAAELHGTAFLSIYDRGDAVCLDRLHDMKGIEVHWWAVGGTLPYNCGAAPRLLLAYQSGAEIERVLRQPAKALTPKSVTSAAALRKVMARIRARGWELAIDDVAVGLSALAVPVRDAAGGLACAISVAGLTPQMAPRGKPAALAEVQKAAAAIERRLRGPR